MKKIINVPRLLSGWVANWLFALGLPLWINNQVLPYSINVVMLAFIGMTFTAIIELLTSPTYKEPTNESIPQER